MASYVVMEPGGGGREAADEARFVRDGFAFLAFVFTFFWFLWHRMWIEAAAAFVFMLLLGGLTSLQPFADIGPIISLLVSILIGLEANTLRIAALERRGWQASSVIEAVDRDEAEIRYVHDTVSEAVDRAATAPPTNPVSPPIATPVASAGSTGQRRPSGPAVGLFDYPGR